MTRRADESYCDQQARTGGFIESLGFGALNGDHGFRSGAHRRFPF
jgi:hypothetical protein